ncbi:MAG TPA: type I-E CRISPR-associated protein Cas5/CasD [Armatimonadetes bacterium]|nr:type I-E CRISPR-associated protein Cas5/CasD [Armatimonadota bacterium]
MATLLLCLAGPMQSWGTRSRFGDRDTERFPSKSGVLGLACAALGWPRDAAGHQGWTMAELAGLAMAARADQPGRLARDFQTVQDVPAADGSRPGTALSTRHYLADATFLVGLSGDEGLLTAIEAALRRPVWPLFLGRKGYAPSRPVVLPSRRAVGRSEWEPLPPALSDVPLAAAIRAYPWLPEALRLERRGRAPQPPESVWLEEEAADGLPRTDVPVGSFGRRRFVTRMVNHVKVALPALEAAESEEVSA